MSEEKEDQVEEDALDENEEGEDGDSDGEAAGGKGKLILFIAVPLILLIGAGAGLYFTGMLDSLIGKKETKQEIELDEFGQPIEQGKNDGILGPAFLEVPSMIVNLNSSDGTARYLRLSVQLELKSLNEVDKVQEVLPRVVDQFQTYLRELRIQDLRGSAGIYRLQMELLWRVNQAAYPIEIQDVLFQEILIQ